MESGRGGRLEDSKGAWRSPSPSGTRTGQLGRAWAWRAPGGRPAQFDSKKEFKLAEIFKGLQEVRFLLLVQGGFSREGACMPSRIRSLS